MARPINIFYLGKGGVGKSTSAALNSLFLSKKGFNVLLVSLDPAHNQSDIFEKKLSDKPKPLAPNLEAIEIDQEHWIKRYLKDVQQQIRRTYSYLTSFNLEKYFKVIKHSPGLEEYALILAFKEIISKFSKNDVLVFDMAPTALSLKFFNLPTLSLVWITHLLALRKEIIKKREL
ncbi:MAG: ArsA family ATPase, partial [Deltaproteobacteria bacterium]|nr:ArsA family ATPase [Deltaproteobacteria bacterium]MBW2083824.1 ArsA family ATPase [Deltaproteobacteria bacterium]HDM09396.1 ArsA family ATPase [Desulfobacteraceae bacterium]